MSAQPRWDHTEPAPRPVKVPASGIEPGSDRNAVRIVSVIAMSSIAAGAINAAAAATVARGSAQNLAFFWTVALAQVVWGAVVLVRAPRWWLALGALGNAIVVATWVVSRTVGLPFGDLAGVVLPAGFSDALAQVVWGAVALVTAPRWWLALGALGNAIVVATWVVSRTVGLPFGDLAGVVLPAGFSDSLATILEAVTVIGAAWLAVRGLSPARSAARARGFALAAAIVIGALGLAGVMSQANATSSGGNGGGGQNVPTAPNGGGGYGGAHYGY